MRLTNSELTRVEKDGSITMSGKTLNAFLAGSRGNLRTVLENSLTIIAYAEDYSDEKIMEGMKNIDVLCKGYC